MDINTYYDQLASTYDKDRFGNAYGSYIDQQERRLLQSWVGQQEIQKNLDLGCGTGRFLDFAGNGIDFSEQMIAQAKTKYPDRQLTIGDIENTRFPEESFDTVFSFHVLMHLDKTKTDAVFREVFRILKPGGRFIFDIPSQKRRKLSKRPTLDWHGANAFSLKAIQELTQQDWHLQRMKGILFFPIHRLPSKLRTFFLPCDQLLCASPVKEYASYLAIELVKK